MRSHSLYFHFRVVYKALLRPPKTLTTQIAGNYNDHADGADAPGSSGFYYPTGSIMVKAGCTFYAYKEDNYNGELRPFVGPVVVGDPHPAVEGDHVCADG